MTTIDAGFEASDAELVARTLAGDREAFSRIVERHQTLVCSLAYNILGNLGESEDAAQETFIVAWKRLRRLREPSKLRAWLCGIVNNRARDRRRREQRQADAGLEPMEQAQEIPAGEALPSERAISAEEQEILWRALERLPETYREPLILFYREHCSVERVAADLELTPDAVKQRLARGRKMLHLEVIEFVEATLRRSGPGRGFTAGVLGALPGAAGWAGAGTATAKGAAAKSGGMMAALTGSSGAWGGILAGAGAQWLILRATPTRAEKRVKALWFGAVWAVVGLAWAAQSLVGFLGRRYAWSERTVVWVQAAAWWIYAALIATIGIGLFRWVIGWRRAQAEATGGAAAPQEGHWGRAIAMTGLVYGANVYWVAALAWRGRDAAALWTLGLATAALIGWHFYRLKGKNRDEAMGVHGSQLALVWGLILLTLNFRLDDWLANGRGISLAQWREVCPGWMIPGLTAALLAWAGVALWVTRPGVRRRG